MQRKYGPTQYTHTPPQISGCIIHPVRVHAITLSAASAALATGGTQRAPLLRCAKSPLSTAHRSLSPSLAPLPHRDRLPFCTPHPLPRLSRPLFSHSQCQRLTGNAYSAKRANTKRSTSNLTSRTAQNDPASFNTPTNYRITSYVGQFTAQRVCNTVPFSPLVGP